MMRCVSASGGEGEEEGVETKKMKLSVESPSFASPFSTTPGSDSRFNPHHSNHGSFGPNGNSAGSGGIDEAAAACQGLSSSFGHSEPAFPNTGAPLCFSSPLELTDPWGGQFEFQNPMEQQNILQDHNLMIQNASHHTFPNIHGGGGDHGFHSYAARPQHHSQTHSQQAGGFSHQTLNLNVPLTLKQAVPHTQQTPKEQPLCPPIDSLSERGSTLTGNRNIKEEPHSNSPSLVPIKREQRSPSENQSGPPAQSLAASSAVGDRSGESSEQIYDDAVRIRNVVTSFTVRCHVDLRKLAASLCHVYYERSKGVLTKQMRNPRCFVKIFSSGNVSLVGCRNEEDAKRGSRRVARMIQKLFPAARFCNFRICNVMATCRLPFGIRIEKVHEDYRHTGKVEYEPELNVGLIWRSKDPKATLRIYTTGSITITGALSGAAVVSVVKMVYPILAEYQGPRAEKKVGKPKRILDMKDFPRAAPYGDGDLSSFSDDEDEELDEEEEEEFLHRV